MFVRRVPSCQLLWRNRLRRFVLVEGGWYYRRDSEKKETFLYLCLSLFCTHINHEKKKIWFQSFSPGGLLDSLLLWYWPNVNKIYVFWCKVKHHSCKVICNRGKMQWYDSTLKRIYMFFPFAPLFVSLIDERKRTKRLRVVTCRLALWPWSFSF